MIKENLEKIRATLPKSVTLVAVSKTKPVSDLQEAYNAGQRVFGENHALEMRDKHEALPQDIQWHFIGHLQTNKLKLVLPYVSLVQSVDSFHLLESISTWAANNNKVIDVLLELHLGAEETKHGFTEEEILSLIERSVASVRIRGLMGMATNTDDMSVVEKDFERIERLYNKIKALGVEGFDQLSIGMSGDWPLAVKHGATMVRIGTDIFGPREY